MYQVHRSKNPAMSASMALAGKSGLSLAREYGFHPATVSHILNNRVWPNPHPVKRIARALYAVPKGGGQ